MRGWHLSGVICGVAVLCLTVMAPARSGAAFAQVALKDSSRPPSADQSPLDRMVSLDLRDVTLEAALREIGRQSGVALVYSRTFVPLTRRVTIEASHVTVRDALWRVLEGTGFAAGLGVGGSVVIEQRPADGSSRRIQVGTIVGRVTDAKTQTVLAGATVVVAAGAWRSATTANDGRYRIADVEPGRYTVWARYIGYVPGSASVTVSADQEATADFTLEKSAQQLDEVVTTGTVVPTEVKALPTPISVITADDIQSQNLQRVDQIFRGQVPGAISWDQGWGDYQSTIAVRGASTINTDDASIKTFVDGVEVADPIYIAMIDPNSIDRVEVIRGPQASTVYGAGALSGVMQIFTKKGALGRTRPEVTAKFSAGGIGGVSGQSTAVQTDNTISVLGGSEKASYNLGGSYRHVGEWLPSYGSTNWGLSGGIQTTQGPLTLSSSLRYADKTFDAPWDTRFLSFHPFFDTPPYLTDRMRQQTYGATANLQATRTWQHTLTAGYDQTDFGTLQTQPQFRTPADSFVGLLAFHQSKASLLYHTDLQVRLGRSVAAVVTAGFNYDGYDHLLTQSFDATRTTGMLDGSSFITRTPSSTTGYFGQVQLNLAERLFVTGGLRAERNPDFGTAYGTAWSPRVGASYVLGLGPATVKLRASYGESIRAPLPGERDSTRFGINVQLANPALAPERQRGVDGGVDVYVGRASLGVTYYSQRAINLIDQTTVSSPSDTLFTTQFTNVGRVKNEGWEFEGRLPLGRLQLAGTYSITSSIVQEVTPNYGGDYQVGDQIRRIPHTTAGATVTYSPLPQTTLTASVTHIGHWIENDVVALYGNIFGDQPYRGSARAYWMEYPTVTKFAIGASQALAKNVTAFVRAENVGDNRRAEQTNLDIPTPRSVIAGANVHF